MVLIQFWVLSMKKVKGTLLSPTLLIMQILLPLSFVGLFLLIGDPLAVREPFPADVSTPEPVFFLQGHHHSLKAALSAVAVLEASSFVCFCLFLSLPRENDDLADAHLNFSSFFVVSQLSAPCCRIPSTLQSSSSSPTALLPPYPLLFRPTPSPDLLLFPSFFMRLTCPLTD